MRIDQVEVVLHTLCPLAHSLEREFFYHIETNQLHYTVLFPNHSIYIQHRKGSYREDTVLESLQNHLGSCPKYEVSVSSSYDIVCWRCYKPPNNLSIDSNAVSGSTTLSPSITIG